MKKYQTYIHDMLEKHQELFTKFKKVHDQYKENPEMVKQEFNTVGSEVLDIIRRYENLLCGTTERGGYAKYSSNLSEKFWQEIRKLYPKIDFVGVQ